MPSTQGTGAGSAGQRRGTPVSLGASPTLVFPGCVLLALSLLTSEQRLPTTVSLTHSCLPWLEAITGPLHLFSENQPRPSSASSPKEGP